jgi:drug/metabolite transporter (DMT)-like permease
LNGVSGPGLDPNAITSATGPAKSLIRYRLAALSAVVFWGISFVATKAALRELSPITLIFSRFAIGTTLLLIILLLRRKFVLPGSQAYPSLFVMGLIGIFIHQMLQVHALTLTTAVHTGWLIGLIPIWSAIFAAIFLREKFGSLKLAGLALGFLGAILVVTHGNHEGSFLALPSTRGDLLILLSTINWAIYTILGRRTIQNVGSLRATTFVMLFGWLLLVPFFAASAGWREFTHLSSSGWGALLFLGVACSGLGYLFWYGALEHLEASRVASFLYIEPVVTLIAAMIVLHEPLILTTLMGGLLVLAGVFLVQRAPAGK